ncbi:hypothetical protein Clacol_001021 [Clathrus columnatus]|uniref:Uncharacterized protein n=1 Tax=Clathrus columnatus TaxID=1419009 RepID=A0AAV4ZYA7_9AGAM|nr:hypothetical protein Clacol_001021 [Clathrus columnatus]
MGGFGITDRERNPVRVFMLGPSIRDKSKTIKIQLPDSVGASIEGSVRLLFHRSTDETAKTRTVLTLDTIVKAAVEAVMDAAVLNAVMNTVADAVTNSVMDIGMSEILTAALRDAGGLLDLPVVSETILDHGALDSLISSWGTSVAEIAVNTLSDTMAERTLKVVEAERKTSDITDGKLRPEDLSVKLRNRFNNRLWYIDLNLDIGNMLRDRLRIKLRENKLKRTLDTLVDCRREDIQDKSKQDGLAKTFALIQTIWFVVQCIARKVENLPLTEIELMTCAYAILSVAIYVFWWNKPFRVNYPILLHSEVPHKHRQLDSVQLKPWNPITLAKFLHGSLPQVYFSISKQILPILVSLYIIARLAIRLVLAIVSLRRLPSGAFADVHWIKFIPHID